MDVDSPQASAPNGNLSILARVHDARNTNGLRQQDYTRYRHFCSRELQKLRKALHLTQRTGKKYTAKIYTADQVRADDRCLLLPLLEAERAWAYSQELKEASASSGEPGQRYHHTRRLRKALQYARELLDLTTLRLATRQVRLETYAYLLLLNSQLLVSQGEWSPALAILAAARHVLITLGQSPNHGFASVCHSLVEELDPQIRYCAYKLRLPATTGDWGQFARDYLVEHEADVWCTVDEHCLAERPSVEAKEAPEKVAISFPEVDRKAATSQDLRRLLTVEDTADSNIPGDVQPAIVWNGLRATLASAETGQAFDAAIASTKQTLAANGHTAMDTDGPSTPRPLSVLTALIFLTRDFPQAAPADSWATLVKTWSTCVRRCHQDVQLVETAGRKVQSQVVDQRLTDAQFTHDVAVYYRRVAQVYFALCQLRTSVYAAQRDGESESSSPSAINDKVRAIDDPNRSLKCRNSALADMVVLYDQCLAHLDAVLQLSAVTVCEPLATNVKVASLSLRAQRTTLVAYSYDNARAHPQAVVLYDRALAYLTQCKALTAACQRGGDAANAILLGFNGLTLHNVPTPEATPKSLSEPAVNGGQSGAGNSLGQILNGSLPQLESFVNGRKVRAQAAWSLAGSATTAAATGSDDTTTDQHLANLMAQSLSLHGSTALASGSANCTVHASLLSHPEEGVAMCTVPVAFTGHSHEEHGVGAVVPRLIDLPPTFQPLANKPMFFDLAGSLIDVPMDIVQKRAGKEDGVLGGIKGLLGNIWGR
ncbi:signal recognition particle subunit srp68 [Tieghemiomyces parasiticus]|uniref:Signal recognition particle subunit SRP68 n=1 Tax=Tieghemiomyces parasiticus TaxID=78921 RepID=A0A9W8ADY7_9FUNG|nr:signal recognition particle subunit srp68 [Tieghemiomyces parasiticus]